MYALDTISFPGFCGSYEEIHGWSQSYYVHLIVKHHVNHFRFQSLSTLSMVVCTACIPCSANFWNGFRGLTLNMKDFLYFMKNC